MSFADASLDLTVVSSLSAWVAPLGRAALFGGLLAVLVWLVTRRAGRLAAGLVAVLWWVVAFQFLFALAWRKPIEVPILPVQAVEQANSSPASAPRTTSAFARPAQENETRSTRQLPRGSSQGAGRPIATVLVLLWLLGCLAQVPRAARALVASRRLRRAARPIEDAALLARAARIARRLGLSRMPKLGVSDELTVPQVMGLLRPVVLLPADLAEPDLDLALGHEFAHLVRRDLWLGLVPALAERLFFFHPLARLAAREYALAREAACDARVLGALDAPAERYGRLLIRFGACPRRTAFAATGASPTFHLLKRRLIMLQNPTPKGHRSWPWLVLAGALGVVALAPFRLTAKSEEPRWIGSPQRAITAQDSGSTGTSDRYAKAERPVPPPPPPPAPPAPPAPPKAPKHTMSWNDHDGDPWILLHGDSATMSGSTDDIRHAKAVRHGDEDVLWFRRDGQAYVIRDAATLTALKEAFRPQIALGEKQGELGAQQGRLGAKQGLLGAKQGELGAKQGALGARQARFDRGEEKESAELEKEMDELGRKQEELGRQQEELGEQQEKLGEQQEELGRQQEEASRVAERQLKKITDEAIARGLAEKVR